MVGIGKVKVVDVSKVRAVDVGEAKAVVRGLHEQHSAQAP